MDGLGVKTQAKNAALANVACLTVHKACRVKALPDHSATWGSITRIDFHLP